MRKGQAAMEFLMTYGWAILVVLAAIGALAYFGVLSPDKFLPDKCTANPPFSCTEYKVTASDVQIKLQNNAGVDMDNVNVTLNSTNCDPATAPGTQTYANVANGDAVNNTLLTFTCDAGSASKFKGTFTIDYQKAGETVWHQSTGSLQAKVE